MLRTTSSAPNLRVVVGAPLAFNEMTLHLHQVEARQQIVNEGDVFLFEFAAIHRTELPAARGEGSGLTCHPGFHR